MNEPRTLIEKTPLSEAYTFFTYQGNKQQVKDEIAYARERLEINSDYVFSVSGSRKGLLHCQTFNRLVKGNPELEILALTEVREGSTYCIKATSRSENPSNVALELENIVDLLRQELVARKSGFRSNTVYREEQGYKSEVMEIPGQ